MVSHHALNMSGVQNPSERLGECIWGVDDTRDVAHFDVSSNFPILDGKVLDVDVVGVISGNLIINHKDGQHVVLVDGHRGFLLETEVS